MATAHVISRHATKHIDIRSYFEYSSHGVQVEEDGLKEIAFGEYLVEQGVIDRYQLFRALQMQDRIKGVRLGEAAAALGYVSIGAIEKMYAQLARAPEITVP